MAKIAEKSASQKRRETKLSKKSNEELIQIILRKDKTERNLSSQVINLKAEVNSANKIIDNIKKDMEGTIKSLNDKHAEDLNVISNRADNLYKNLIDAELEHNNLIKTNVELNNKVKSFKTLSIISIIVGLSIAIISYVC